MSDVSGTTAHYAGRALDARPRTAAVATLVEGAKTAEAAVGWVLQQLNPTLSPRYFNPTS